MNRADRRRMQKALGFKWSGNPTSVHRCDMDGLTRVRGLDGSIPGERCGPCDGSGFIIDGLTVEGPCPSCVDGRVPITYFNAYTCPKCLKKWIRMSYTLRDVTHVDWKTADELIKGE